MNAAAIKRVIKRKSRAHLLLCAVLSLVLVLISCYSCVQHSPAIMPQPGEHVLPPQPDSKTTVFNQSSDSLTAEDNNWKMVTTISSNDVDNSSFAISSPEWRIRWDVETRQPEYCSIDMLLYCGDNESVPIEHICSSGAMPCQPVYIGRGDGEFRIKVTAANLTGWRVVIEEPAVEGISHPIQITRIQFRGHIYEDTTEEAPVPEADEYVEITNHGTEPVPLRGWRLVNATRGNPVFIFPSYFPYNCKGLDIEECIEEGFPPLSCVLEPFHSVRIYTFYLDPESGGLSFNFAPGNIWNNEVPDTAVLYSSSGKEVSRRSYQVYPDDYHSIEKPPANSSG